MIQAVNYLFLNFLGNSKRNYSFFFCFATDPGIGEVCKVPLDHLDVCKPRHRNCLLYRQLTTMISQIIKKNPCGNNEHNQCLML